MSRLSDDQMEFGMKILSMLIRAGVKPDNAWIMMNRIITEELNDRKKLQPMKLSTHLSLSEVTKSDRAIRFSIDNNPTEEHLANLKLLAEKIFEPIRIHFGKPIFVSSGYRSKALNAVTPGSSLNSQHSTGEALDLDQDSANTGITNKMVFDYIKDNLEFDQLIWEYGNNINPNWVHVSYESTGRQRKQILRCVKVNGLPKYSPYK
jgi:zinc D-Ala-D-Ala carboxypeptidase